jgi:hypothetical protein
MIIVFVEVLSVLLVVLAVALASRLVFGPRLSPQMADRATDVWKHRQPPVLPTVGIRP